MLSVESLQQSAATVNAVQKHHRFDPLQMPVCLEIRQEMMKSVFLELLSNLSYFMTVEGNLSIPPWPEMGVSFPRLIHLRCPLHHHGICIIGPFLLDYSLKSTVFFSHVYYFVHLHHGELCAIWFHIQGC